MNITFDPNQPLYHGTFSLYGEFIQKFGIHIFPREKGNGVDFGPGFYLSVGLLDQAVDWARRQCEKPVPNAQILKMAGYTMSDFMGMRNSFKPVVLKYCIKDPVKWLELRNKTFLSDSLSWKQFVRKMRDELMPPDAYDWVFGPVADGGIFTESYMDIKAFENKNQLSVHNVETGKELALVEVMLC